MTDHHHPESTRPEPPTPKQQRYLRVLAQRNRQTFVVPKTKAEASAEIRRLERSAPASRSDRTRDDRFVSRGLATVRGARIREDETTTTGHGSSARWA
jgi:hypothetical protein